MQRNWIGKTENIEIFFNILNSNKKIIIYTNKLNILMHVTYIIITLNHTLSIEESKKQKKINEFYNKYIKKKKINNLKKRGINTNLFAVHPISKIKLPIWIINYNLFNNINNSNIGVPRYNKYDLKFAKKYNLPINVITKKKINNVKKYYKFILNKLINLKLARKKIFYKLTNWNISRQRYWGTPIPIAINIKNNNIITIPQNKLPVILPENILINNLINSIKLNLKWPKIFINNQYFKLETDTLDTFIESSWYYLRYTCPKYNKNIIKLKSVNYWLPVDQYIGGIEHAVMHLLYFRFLHKIFRDFGFINCNEPVKKLICQGMVLSNAFYYLNIKKEKIWVSKNKININFNFIKKKIELRDKKNNKIKYGGMIKMSKSKKNGINPVKIINKYGSDSVRLFIILSSPIEMELEWNESQLIGIHRFIKRLWKIFFLHIKIKKIKSLKIKILNIKQKEIIFFLHKLIYKVTYDIKYKQSLNTAISKIIKFINKLNYFIIKNNFDIVIFHECLLVLIRLLYPFIPHLCFKLWKLLGEKGDIDFISWPIFNKKILIKKTKIIIQINGKFYNKIKIKFNYNKEFILNIIIKKFFNKNKFINNILKIIYIKKKIFNIILKSKI